MCLCTSRSGIHAVLLRLHLCVCRLLLERDVRRRQLKLCHSNALVFDHVQTHAEERCKERPTVCHAVDLLLVVGSRHFLERVIRETILCTVIFDFLCDCIQRLVEIGCEVRPTVRQNVD